MSALLARFLRKIPLKRVASGLGLGAAVVLLITFFDGRFFRYAILAIGVMCIVEIYAMTASRRQEIHQSATSAAIVQCAITTVAFTYAFTVDRFWLLFLLVLAYANDTGAFFVGRLCGGKLFKLRPFPKYSPKKSWEGIIGGVVVCILAGMLTIWLYAELNLASYIVTPRLVIFMVLIPFVGDYGDWLESRLKRLCGVKDSGQLAHAKNRLFAVLESPVCDGSDDSHGGWLDRTDSAMMVLALALLYWNWNI